MIIFRNDFDITDGIEINIINAIDKTIENNSIETFKVLLDFIRNILQLSVSNKSQIHFQKYIYFASHIYAESYSKMKQNPELIHLHKFCTERVAMHQREILLSDIGFERSKFKISGKHDELNRFYYLGFNGFSFLLYYMLKNEDVAQFHIAMNEFDQVVDSNFNSHYDLKVDITRLEIENKNGINDLEIKTKKEELKSIKAFDDYKRHTISGIKYWAIFLFSENKIDQEQATSILDRLIINSDSDDLFQDIIFFGNFHSDYMDWSNWDHIVRQSGKSYTPPSPHNWLLLGLMVEQIRGNKLFINVDNLTSEDLKRARSLYEVLKQKTEYLRGQFERWKKILKVDSIDVFESKSEEILKIFAEIKRKKNSAVEFAIANAPINQDSVSNFRIIVGKAWKYQARIHKLFKKFGNLEHIIDNESKLLQIGQRTFFERAKMSFISGEHFQPIYLMDRIGGEIGRLEDDTFFNSIMNVDYNRLSNSNSVEALGISIVELKNKGKNPSMILLSPEYSYRDHLFLSDKRFVAKDNMIQDGNDTWNFYLGSFDGIPIYSSFSAFIKNRFLICDFNSAFKMRYKTSPGWYENEFKVEVNSVSDEEAIRRLSENPAKWKNTDDGIILTDEEALIAIKTSVIMDIWATVDFQIMDKDAYIIATVKT